MLHSEMDINTMAKLMNVINYSQMRLFLDYLERAEGIFIALRIF